MGVKKECEEKLAKGGDVLELKGNSGKIWGLALRATNEAKTPLIVSIGHRVCLETALTVTKICISKFRIPEPIR
jgi:endonuclease V